MREVCYHARYRPKAKYALPPLRWKIKPEDADRGVIQTVQDGQTGGKIIKFFCNGEVASVKDGAEDPRRNASLSEEHVILAKGVMSRDGGADFVEAGPVGVEVPQGEEDRKRFLHTQNTPEWPLAVELDHLLALGYAFCRDEVLARIVAFGGACPEEQPAVKGDDGRGGR